MHTIKFSYPYRKLFIGGVPVTRAKLLAVEPVRLQDLPAEFLDYDTDGGLYALPKTGDYLRLIFLKPGRDMHLFTTLRRQTPNKLDYYKSKIGELFQVVIEQTASQ